MSIKNILSILLPALLTACAETPADKIEALTTQSGKKIAFVKLDDNHFKIGNIVVDKAARSFEAPGKFLRTEPPIEFLAVAKDGKRGYESLLEFDVNVYEFNLACILIGLDQHKGLPPKAHFDPTPITGDAVTIDLSWEVAGKKHTHPASAFFLVNNHQLSSENWVYTGSTFLPQGPYLADSAGGTLIGFVHDPASIIEHGEGFGAQSYGALKLNTEIMPPMNTPLNASIKYVGNTQK